MEADPVLNEDQRQALATGIRMIERELADVESLLARNYDGALISFFDDLGEAGHHEFQRSISEARRLIRDLGDAFDLPHERLSNSRRLIGPLSQLWAVAAECRSHQLRGFGLVADGLSSRLDPPVRRLTDVLRGLQRLVPSGPPLTGPHDAEAGL
jgi:hypothetical protein